MLVFNLAVKQLIGQSDDDKMLMDVWLLLRVDRLLKTEVVAHFTRPDTLKPLLSRSLQLLRPSAVLHKHTVSPRVNVRNPDIHRYHSRLDLTSQTGREPNLSILKLAVTRTHTSSIDTTRNHRRKCAVHQEPVYIALNLSACSCHNGQWSMFNGQRYCNPSCFSI